MSVTSIGEILRSCQRAFLFNISGNVKSISIKRINQTLSIRTFFYSNPTARDKDLIADAGGEVYGDFEDVDGWELEFFISTDDDEYLEHLIFARAD